MASTWGEVAGRQTSCGELGMAGLLDDVHSGTGEHLHGRLRQLSKRYELWWGFGKHLATGDCDRPGP